MTFPAVLTADTFMQFIGRKELFSLRAGNWRIQSDDRELTRRHLTVASYQTFVSNMFNPYTSNKSLHLLWGAGVGKTIGALVIAHNFTTVYKEIYAQIVSAAVGRREIRAADALAPSIVVLGFTGTKAAFMRDLFDYSYFGFVSIAEREELRRRRNLAESGSASDMKHLRDYYTMLKRRITTKSRGGFFRFYGYDEFVNKLFDSPSTHVSTVEAETLKRIKAGEDIQFENVLAAWIADGRITVNVPFLKTLTNSLLICDEIHEAYNSVMLNSRGVSIRYACDNVEGLRLLTMSMSPINSSAGEFVDWANFHQLPGARVKRSDLFDSDMNMKPGALDNIAKLMFGKVSVVQDTDVRHFPTKSFLGEPYTFMRDVLGFVRGEQLPYLKFISCQMSPLHQQTYDDFVKAYRENSADSADSAKHANADYVPISAGGFTIMDMVFPGEDAQGNLRGMYLSDDIYKTLQSATPEFTNKCGIHLQGRGDIKIINGPFLMRENIGAYSTKLATLFDMIIGVYKSTGPCKMMVYHDRVQLSGVVLVQEFFKANGILDEVSTPTANTICVICGLKLSEHENSASNVKQQRTEQANEQLYNVDTTPARVVPVHTFTAARFIIIHSDIDETTRANSLLKYGLPSNATGTQYSILIGSKVIKQSFDFKAIRKVFIISAPDSIKMILQVIYRTARKYSHIDLPEDQWHVDIAILLTTMRDSTEMSPEIYRYAKKMRMYKIIQPIERVISETAFDSNINWAINMSPEARATYFPNGSTTPIDQLTGLYYEPKLTMPSGILSTTTFIARGHGWGEVRNIVIIVKRLFMQQAVWTYDQLWAAVKAPPFSVEANPAFFSEDNFAIAMDYLSRHARVTEKKVKLTAGMVVDSIFDYSMRYIYRHGNRCAITRVNDWYIAAPFAFTTINTVKGADTITGMPVLDVESYLRIMPKRDGINIPAATITSRENTLYRASIAALSHITNINDFLTEFSVETQIHFVRDIIEERWTVEKFPKHAEILKFLCQLRALITIRDVLAAKEVAAMYRANTRGAKTLDEFRPATIIGYTDSREIWIYTGDRWLSVKREAMNRTRAWTENNITIGTLESSDASTKLKLRRPLSHVREKTRTIKLQAGDIRLIEKGIVCSTKSKGELLSIAAALGQSNKERSEFRVRALCTAIRDMLVSREIAERAKNTTIKYLYGWWDDSA